MENGEEVLKRLILVSCQEKVQFNRHIVVSSNIKILKLVKRIGLNIETKVSPEILQFFGK